MKVIILGGAGDVGSRAAEVCAAADDVELVTIADRNLEVANRVKSSIEQRKSTKAKIAVVQCDAFNHDSLVAALKGHDVAGSALGPFTVFEKRCVKAAIDAKVHYASVCDDWDAAMDILELHDAAKKNKIVICSGIGTTPGLSNVAIRHMADNCDDFNKVRIACYQPLNAGGGEAVLRHMMFVMSGDVAVFRNGKAVKEPACSEYYDLDFPKYGVKRMWLMGHGEPVTIPHYIKKVKNVGYYMGFGTGSELFVYPAKLGLFKYSFVRDCVCYAMSWIDWTMKKINPIPAHGALRVEGWGTKNGKNVHMMLCGTGQMRDATGSALAFGTLIIGRKQLLPEAREGGVFGPEASIDPSTFLKMIWNTVQGYSDIAMKHPVWDQKSGEIVMRCEEEEEEGKKSR